MFFPSLLCLFWCIARHDYGGVRVDRVDVFVLCLLFFMENMWVWALLQGVFMWWQGLLSISSIKKRGLLSTLATVVCDHVFLAASSTMFPLC